MAKNKIITSQGNVQFINSKGRTIDMHPMHCYAVYENDTVSFLFIYMKEYSGQAFFASQFEDLEVNGETYDNMDDLKDAINYAFAKAGAQARTEIVDELPEDPFTNTIYLLPKEHGEGYDEYIWNEDEGWQLIGDTDIEFERYLKIDDFNPYSAATKDYIDAVSGETVANHNDIVALSGAIDTEISARTDADTALSGAIDTVAADLATENQRAVSAETQLQNNINTVNGRVDAEQIARAQADTALSGAIDSVSGAVDTEVSARTAADEALDSKIDTVSGDVISETSRAESAETALQTAINDEASARTAADSALSGAVEAVDGKVDTLSGEVQTMGEEAVVDAAYVSSSTTIEFYNASGDVVASIDATDFVKDGMIEDVRIEEISGVTYLVIDFNTASGIEDIQIPLTDFFNPDNYYDKTAVDGFVSDLEAADSVISGAVDTLSSDLATEAQRAQDAEDALSGAIDTKLAISDFNTYSASVETALSGKANASDVYTRSEVYTKAEVDEAIAEIDLSDYYTKTETDGLLDDKADLSALTEDERVWGEALNDLNSRINTVSGDVATKASQSAVDALNGVVTAHTANTTVHVTAAEKSTWNNKSDFSGSYNDLTNKLSAGTNITIVDNVINATGGGSIDVDSALSPTSENPVQNKVLFDELRITESEGSETKLIWEEAGYNNFRTTNFPSGYTTIKVVIKEGQGLGFFFHNSNGVQLGTYSIYNITELEVTNNFDGSTYTVDGNNVTITWDASKDVVELSTDGSGEIYDYIAEFYAVDEPVYSTLKEVVSGKVDTTDFNSYSGAVESRIVEDEEVTSAGLNALNDKFGGLKLMKITQAAYDALTVKDNNTLYIISD